ncbi:MAG: HEAT repeat domain-containing protein [Phycisphaerales bacterium]|nr:HEAT repeat domain-containing protein [Phycisphaerales bacterium]
MTTPTPRLFPSTSAARPCSGPGRRAAAVFAGVLGLVILVAPVQAQLAGSLPETIVQSDSLSGEDKAQILEYVKRHAPGLGGTPEQISVSRKALIRPFRSDKIGTAFRVEYADAAVVNASGAKLKDLLKSPNEQTAINAASVLGEIGARPSLDALLPAIKEREPNRPAVRLVAALGVARTFDAVRGPGQPALSKNDASRALTDLQSALRTEPNADVADALVAAFNSAAKVPEGKIPGIRNDAAQGLCAAIQARIKDPNAAGFHSAYARAAKALFEGVIDENVNSGFSSATIIQAGGVAGDLVAFVRRQIDANASTDGWAAPDSLGQIVRAAETLASYAARKAGATPLSSLNLDQSLNGQPSPGGDKPAVPADFEKFKRDADRLIGPDGLLIKPPFAFPIDRYK